MQGRVGDLSPPARPVRGHLERCSARALASDAHMVIVNIEASAGSKDYTAHVLKELGRVWAAAWWPQPLKRRAGSVTSLTRTDGILRIPAESDGVEEDSEVTA